MTLSSGIFHIQKGVLTELAEAPFSEESEFQELLARHPNLIAGDLMNREHPRRWLLVQREVGVPDEDAAADRWSLDHLFLDQEGIPTLVEVKRSTDTRLRREVVGQLLDYAANATVFWAPENIRSQFTLRCERDRLDPEQEVRGLLGPEGDIEAFWTDVKTNLQAGKVRLLFVSEVVPSELRRIVEFLNRQMDPAEVLAVELRRFSHGDVQTLVPRVIGLTAEAEARKGGERLPARKWDEASFFAAVDELESARAKATIRAIYDWAKADAEISWGQGPKTGAFHVSAPAGKAKAFYVYSNGSLSFHPPNLRGMALFNDVDAEERLVSQLEGIPDLSRGRQSSWRDSWVSYRLEDVRDSSGEKQLLSLLKWMIDTVKTGMIT